MTNMCNLESTQSSLDTSSLKLNNKKNNSNEVRSSPEHTKLVWKQKWKLAVPSEIKNFLWRACRNALPTNANLVQRYVMTDSRCCVCNSHDENVLHCLWSCPSLSTVWGEDPQWNFRSITTLTGFAQLLQYVLALDCSSELFAMVTWTVWLKRNKVRFSPPGFPNDQVMQRAVAALMEY